MSDFEVIPQPTISTVSATLQAALLDNRYDTLRSAVAYITTSGVQELHQALSTSSLHKSWLTSFDWCRSDPAALSALQQQQGSTVRVHDGKQVVARRGCTPTTPFHLKKFLFTGPEHALLVSGSANMSRNGLRQGVEFDTAIAVTGRGKKTLTAWKRIGAARDWFDAQWSRADRFAALAPGYKVEFARRPAASAVLEFGDTSAFVRRGFTAEQLAQISRAETMWIEAGNLTARTSASPGHQLMMRPLTRVFFGFAPVQVPRMTSLGPVSIYFDGVLNADRSLEFAHNSMDRLNLPTSTAAGTAQYDGKVLKFTKFAMNGAVAFELSIIGKREQNSLRRMSRRLGLSFTMPGGRTFGFI